MYIGDFPYNDYFAPKGWVCPKCGRVYSPSTPMCWYCGDKQITNTPNTTGTPVNWDEYLRKTSRGPTDTPSVPLNNETYSPTSPRIEIKYNPNKESIWFIN